MVYKHNRKGFSLIELLVVMMILGLLASLVGPSLFGKVDSSKVKTAKAQIQLLETALDTYRLDVGNYPPNLSELMTSSQRFWDGPYLAKDIPLDPWGNSFSYKIPGVNGKPYSLVSLGSDGKLGGEGLAADISG